MADECFNVFPDITGFDSGLGFSFVLAGKPTSVAGRADSWSAKSGYKPVLKSLVGGKMNKSDLIEIMAEAGDISKAAAGRALDGLIDAIAVSLKEEEAVSILGFGTFSIKKRSARMGRNPKTGQAIAIPASKTPAFKAGKGLKEAVQ